MNPKDLAGQDKPQMHLIPPVAEIAEAEVMGLGAKKYGPYNWRKLSVNASTYVSAARRHMNAWWDGQDIDPESGQSHLAHVRANMGILLDAEANGCLQDDRPSSERQNTTSEMEHGPIKSKREVMHALEQALGAAVRCEIAALQMMRARLEHTGFGRSIVRLLERSLCVPDEWNGKIVYVSGPMRGKPDLNFPAFDRRRDELLTQGYAVVSPADMDRYSGENATNAHVRQYLARDMAALAVSDYISFLPGWLHSKGALAEHAAAGWLGVDVLENSDREGS